MTDSLLTEEMHEFLEKNEFVYLATADASGHPFVIPKFLIKAAQDADNEMVYLADFVFGRTIENIKVCSRVSFSTLDMNTLTGYQMNGKARILEECAERDKLLPHLNKRQLHFSVERIVEAVQRGKKHENFEAAFPEKFAVIEVTIEEVIDVFASGKINRRSKRL